MCVCVCGGGGGGGGQQYNNVQEAGATHTHLPPPMLSIICCRLFGLLAVCLYVCVRDVDSVYSHFLPHAA